MSWLLMVIVAGHFQIVEVANSESECESLAKMYQGKMSMASTVCVTTDTVLGNIE